MIHYFTLIHTISHCDTPSQQRLNIAASAPPSRHCHYLALRWLCSSHHCLPPHSTGCSVHLEGVMLSTSVERAPGKTCNVSRWGGSGFETQQSNSKKQWRRQRQRRQKWQRQRSGGGDSSAVALEATVAAAAQQQRSGGGGSSGGGSGSGSAAEAAAAAAQQRLQQQRSGSGCQNGHSSLLSKLIRYYLVYSDT